MSEYCNRRGIPHSDECKRPSLAAERLDNARTGQEWGSVLGELISALEKATEADE